MTPILHEIQKDTIMTLPIETYTAINSTISTNGAKVNLTGTRITVGLHVIADITYEQFEEFSTSEMTATSIDDDYLIVFSKGLRHLLISKNNPNGFIIEDYTQVVVNPSSTSPYTDYFTVSPSGEFRVISYRCIPPSSDIALHRFYPELKFSCVEEILYVDNVNVILRAEDGDIVDAFGQSLSSDLVELYTPWDTSILDYVAKELVTPTTPTLNRETFEEVIARQSEVGVYTLNDHYFTWHSPKDGIYTVNLKSGDVTLLREWIPFGGVTIIHYGLYIFIGCRITNASVAKYAVFDTSTLS